MTLQQLLTFTAAYEPSDVRRAMAAVLARDPPRGAEAYRRFYRAVCLRLTAGRHHHAPQRERASTPRIGGVIETAKRVWRRPSGLRSHG